MFKFDFKVELADSESPFNIKQEKNAKEVQDKNDNASIEWYDSDEVAPREELLDLLNIYELNAMEKECGNVTINYAACGFLLGKVIKEEISGKDDIRKSEENHSDLLPGIYEGGAKIWECTDDLLQYMAAKFSESDWQSKRVLDLGCGAGLLGIYAFKCGAEVHFQDYNIDVVHNITIPNVLLNVELAEKPCFDEIKRKLSLVKFYSGDWEKYAQLTKDAEKFDWILSSETIYNADNQQKLVNTFAEKLKDDGTVLLASKTHYFGVGGGLRQFEATIIADKRFTLKVVYSTQDAGVMREILMLKRKNTGV